MRGREEGWAGKWVRFDRRAAPHTVKEMFLYSTVSTLKPMVGMVVTISPSLSLYRMVVLPAASRPTIRMRTSFLPNSLPKTLLKDKPMLRCCLSSVDSAADASLTSAFSTAWGDNSQPTTTGLGRSLLNRGQGSD